jgi:hypothetical protein
MTGENGTARPGFSGVGLGMTTSWLRLEKSS